jgi:diguanylate cyclase (GGDEF)-like protein
MTDALDALTGLPGHHAMNAMLEGAGPGWLVFADIDAMAFALGVLGGERSDQVLRDVAHVVRDVCQPRALVARYGSDEFLVHVPAAVDAPGLAERVRAAVEARFEDERRTIRAGTGGAGLIDAPPMLLTLSVAVAPFEGDVKSAVRAVLDANERAKAEGRNRVVVVSTRGPAELR